MALGWIKKKGGRFFCIRSQQQQARQKTQHTHIGPAGIIPPVLLPGWHTHDGCHCYRPKGVSCTLHVTCSLPVLFTGSALDDLLFFWRDTQKFGELLYASFASGQSRSTSPPGPPHSPLGSLQLNLDPLESRNLLAQLVRLRLLLLPQSKLPSQTPQLLHELATYIAGDFSFFLHLRGRERLALRLIEFRAEQTK